MEKRNWNDTLVVLFRPLSIAALAVIFFAIIFGLFALFYKNAQMATVQEKAKRQERLASQTAQDWYEAAKRIHDLGPNDEQLLIKLNEVLINVKWVREKECWVVDWDVYSSGLQNEGSTENRRPYLFFRITNTIKRNGNWTSAYGEGMILATPQRVCAWGAPEPPPLFLGIQAPGGQVAEKVFWAFPSQQQENAQW